MLCADANQHRCFKASIPSAAILLSASVIGVLIGGTQGAFRNSADAQDLMHRIQADAVRSKVSPVAHWGVDPNRYSSWVTHSNRLIPVYTYGTRDGGKGIDLNDYTGDNSVYRNQDALRRIYRSPAEGSLEPNAEYMDQTNIFDLQLAALTAGRKYIFLVVFDGMDWQTTQAAAIWNQQAVTYESGRGTGTFFQEYDAGGTSQYGWMVTSPYSFALPIDVNEQKVVRPDGSMLGGYSGMLGGMTPWDPPKDIPYLISQSKTAEWNHAYNDSASTATTMMSGIKTYYDAVNVDPFGVWQETIAHRAQKQGYRVGLVTSVPISHATPAAAYAHNVTRDDYQDISRDLLGLPSINHPNQPLPGLDVVIGTGWGIIVDADEGQGKNFVPGNRYLADADLIASKVEKGGRYVVAQRSPGRNGKRVLDQAADQAVRNHQRLLGFFGVGGNSTDGSGHLPYASADGDYQPAPGIAGEDIVYTVGDITENPTLEDMTNAAIKVLSAQDQGFWILVEAGDVDWANHSNNLDASIGSVNSGDAAVKAIADWVEANSSWEESVMIVTADHGHYMFLDRPELLIRANHPAREGDSQPESP